MNHFKNRHVTKAEDPRQIKHQNLPPTSPHGYTKFDTVSNNVLHNAYHFISTRIHRHTVAMGCWLSEFYRSWNSQSTADSWSSTPTRAC